MVNAALTNKQKKSKVDSADKYANETNKVDVAKRLM